MDRLVAHCSAVAVVLCMLGCGNKRSEPEPPSNVTTIPGTFSWDVATGKFSAHVGDFAWEHISETTRNLVPINGTRARLVEDRPFDVIRRNFIEGHALPADKISASDVDGVLHVGSVIVFRTSQGKYGKLRIEGFRSLHEFSFPELAAAFSDESRLDAWKSKATQRPDFEKYHLVVRWCLYP
jgi:hypothetical protein